MSIPISTATPLHCHKGTFPAEVTERVRGLDLKLLPRTIRKRMGFTGFAPILESIFTLFYEVRFRGWMRAGVGIMAVYYAFRWYTMLMENAQHPLSAMVGVLTAGWIVLWGLGYSPLSLRRLQWLAVPLLMLMLWSIVALNHTAWLNGNDQVGAAQVMAPFVIGLGLFRFPLRMGLMATGILLATLVVAYGTFGVPLFPQAAGLIGITVGVFLLFYTTLEREARQDFTTRLMLFHLATTDGLTGTANRGYFLEQIGRALAGANCVALMLFDVDKFKAVNDTYGHAAGDAALQSIGAILREAAGEQGLAGRIGGEEFALFLPCCTPQSAEALAETIATKVRTTLIPYAHGSFRVTISGGIATSAAPHIATVERLLQQADRLLYQAKHEGRNRVMQG